MLAQQPITLHEDKEHNGIRAAILVMLFIGLFLGFQLSSGIYRLFIPETASDWRIIASCVGSHLFAIGTIWLTEKVLTRLWPSGVKLVLGSPNHDSLSLIRPAETEKQLELTKSAIARGWYFKLNSYPRGGRERQVDKNWLCLAVELQQDETRIVSYTYAPPRRAETWTAVFEEIFPAEVYDTSFSTRFGPPIRPEIPVDILRSKLGPYWLAEKRRWRHGAELSQTDFNTLLQFVNDHGLLN